MGIGPQELILILLVLVLLFGAKKIPELAKGLGNGLKEFKKATKEAEKEIGDTTEQKKEEEPKKSS